MELACLEMPNWFGHSSVPFNAAADGFRRVGPYGPATNWYFCRVPITDRHALRTLPLFHPRSDSVNLYAHILPSLL